MKKSKLREIIKEEVRRYILKEYNWKPEIEEIESKLKTTHDKEAAANIQKLAKTTATKVYDEWEPIYIHALELYLKGGPGHGLKLAKNYLSELEDEV